MRETIERNHNEPSLRLTVYTDEVDDELGGRAMRAVAWVIMTGAALCALYNLVRWMVTR